MSKQTEIPGWVEIASAIVLSVAALASSWAGYQAGLWDGEQAANYSEANSLRIQATRTALEGDALATVEMTMFGSWLDAEAEEQRRLASFYRARFPEGMKVAFNAWLEDRPLVNPSAAPTPFTHPAYHRPGQEAAFALDRQANETFDTGQRANAISDGFEQSATILAVAMFFCGIGQVFQVPAARIGLLTVGSVTMLFGMLKLLSLPIQTLGLI